jgi:hypothetical protein
MEFEQFEEILELRRHNAENGRVYYDALDEVYYTRGDIGDWEFNTLIEVFEYLQGFDVNLNEIFFN